MGRLVRGKSDVDLGAFSYRTPRTRGRGRGLSVVARVCVLKMPAQDECTGRNGASSNIAVVEHARPPSQGKITARPIAKPTLGNANGKRGRRQGDLTMPRAILWLDLGD